MFAFVYNDFGNPRIIQIRETSLQIRNFIKAEKLTSHFLNEVYEGLIKDIM